MTTTYKILGSAAPAGTTSTDLYTVPALTQAVCSTLTVCNRGAQTTFRVSARPSGQAIGNPYYIVYDNVLNAGDTVFLSLGITLGTGDKITVYAGNADLSFSLFGAEVT